jgi:hypothetical protein
MISTDESSSANDETALGVDIIRNGAITLGKEYVSIETPL